MARRGQRRATPHLVLMLASNEEGRGRLALAVSRKVGKAVVRNRFKRRVREIARREILEDLDQDLLVIARPGAGELDFSSLRRELLQGLGRSS